FYYHIRGFLWCIFINEFIFEFSLVEGASMEPTFNQYGDIGLIDKTVNFFRLYNSNFITKKLKKDDVVSVVNPFIPNKRLCKRILAVEDEKVILDEEKNNFIIIPKNHIWIEGDNKENSLDSRMFGPVSKHLVEGRVVSRLWPLDKIKSFI
ncbi:MAG: S26 family signal peptidase, partial [bacterium]